MSAVVRSFKATKVLGVILLAFGIAFIAAGATTWGMVSSQLNDENITIPGDARWFAGEEVRGPLTAYAQADVINEHALAGTEGRTYAELGSAMRDVEPGTAEHEELQAQRDSVMNASFLRASLFTSVLAYGVSALVIGLGVVFIVVAWGMRRIGFALVANEPTRAAPAAKERETELSK
ncbi:aromatic ring-opening dioxygenase LigA [Pseudactinotalea sp. Z1748]|uniref:aromatic ring-opening dioxygenase LigA n=1 Tax=Pseudactinotalea sp. Z1748 TaxID=3413027 RepID=UPI003C7C2A53